MNADKRLPRSVAVLTLVFLGLILGFSAAPARADATYTAHVCLEDSGANPLVPGTTYYKLNGGPQLSFATTVDGSSCKVQAFTVSGAANLEVWTTYNNTSSAHQTQDISTSPTFNFQTQKVTVRVQDAGATGVAGGIVRYGIVSPSTFYFPGTTTPASGELAAEFFPGTYQFSVGLNQTSKAMTQDVGVLPTVVFTTTKVTLGYSGQVAFGGPTGDTAYFKSAGTSPAAKEMFAGTVNFRFDFTGGPIRLPITIDGTPVVKSMIVARLLDPSSSPVSGAAVTYDSGLGYETLGTTNANGIVYLLLDGLLGSVSVKLPDNGGQTITQSQPVNSIYQFQNVVTNQSPVADPGGPYLFPLAAGPFDGSASSDPDSDPLTYAWDFGDGNTGVGVAPSHTYAAAGTYDVCLTVNDGTVDSAPVCTTVVVDQSPVAEAGGPYLVPLNASVSFDGSHSSDPDGDTLTYAWDFGDGNTGVGPAPSHTYAAAGIYDVCLIVNDGNVDSAQACTQAVVYDPSAGFVTGGGWINSPAGAYRPDVSLSGKATFGFVARYKKGATVPDGNTEFVFHAGNLNFSSTRYDWLVVAGSDAKFKGEATVNGVDGYTFQISADDSSPDTFRIQIWSPGGGILYDNGSQQSIGGGSIIVHN